MDLVFVVDDSASMTEEQANLAAHFDLMTKKLDAITTKAGAKLNYRIAVTSTSRSLHYTLHPDPLLPGAPAPPPIPVVEKGGDGRFRKACGMQRPWLERTDPQLATDFACAARVGTSGASLEMPLEALRLALGDRMKDGANAGFLRDDALLAFVVLTDEDDCSRRDDGFAIKDDRCGPGTPGYAPVSDYVAWLDALKGGRDRWTAAVFAGPTACKSAFGEAAEATRLKDLVSQAGSSAVFSSICGGDLSSPLEAALASFDAACRRFTPR